jgi:hypothetical protein
MLMHNFTPEDLLEFHYGELDAETTLKLEQALKEDWTLREKLAVIREASLRLDKSIYTPRQAVVNRIISYASEMANIPVTK